MDLPGAAYFYALAGVAIAFVGFNAIIMVMQQVLGTRHSAYALMATRNFFELGFLVVWAAMLPPLLGLYGVSPVTIWRISSLIAALPFALFVVVYPTRRFTATGARMPWSLRFAYIVSVVDAAVLFANAADFPFKTPEGVYAAAATVILLIAFYLFLHAVGILIAAGNASHR